MEDKEAKPTIKCDWDPDKHDGKPCPHHIHHEDGSIEEKTTEGTESVDTGAVDFTLDDIFSMVGIDKKLVAEDGTIKEPAKMPYSEEEAIQIGEYLFSLIPKDKKDFYTSLAVEEKRELLLGSEKGYDQDVIEQASEDQLNALLYAEALLNANTQIASDLKAIDAKKESFKKALEGKLQGIRDGIGSYNYEIPGVWFSGTKTLEDYEKLSTPGPDGKSSIDKKLEYFQDVINSDVSEEKKQHAQDKIDRIQNFITYAKQYQQNTASIKKYFDEEFFIPLEEKYSELTHSKINFGENPDLQNEVMGVINKFQDSGNPYSQARKDNAVWAQNPDEALAILSSEAQEHFSQMTVHQLDLFRDYKEGSSRFNEPLRGIHYVGGKAMISEGSSYSASKAWANDITAMTEALDKCVWKEDIWVQRGIDFGTKFFGNPKTGYMNIEQAIAKYGIDNLIGMSFKDEGFGSTGAAKGTGFKSDYILNIYMPKGSKGAYINDLAGSSFYHSWENEMLIQRGYEYRITAIKKKSSGSGYYIDCEIILGSDKDKVDVNAASTLYK